MCLLVEIKVLVFSMRTREYQVDQSPVECPLTLTSVTSVHVIIYMVLTRPVLLLLVNWIILYIGLSLISRIEMGYEISD